MCSGLASREGSELLRARVLGRNPISRALTSVLPAVGFPAIEGATDAMPQDTDNELASLDCAWPLLLGPRPGERRLVVIDASERPHAVTLHATRCMVAGSLASRSQPGTASALTLVVTSRRHAELVKPLWDSVVYLRLADISYQLARERSLAMSVSESHLPFESEPLAKAYLACCAPLLHHLKNGEYMTGPQLNLNRRALQDLFTRAREDIETLDHGPVKERLLCFVERGEGILRGNRRLSNRDRAEWRADWECSGRLLASLAELSENHGF